MVGRVKVPRDAYLLIPRTCEYVALHGKRDLAVATTLEILRWGDHPGSSRWALRVLRPHGGRQSDGEAAGFPSGRRAPEPRG